MRIIQHLSFVALALAVTICPSWSKATQTDASSKQTTDAARKFQFSSGALLRVALDKTLDAKKVKVGDAVVVKLTDDIKWNATVLAARGASITGHITQAAQRQGESPSVLGIAFDKLRLTDGSDVSLKAVIQAVGFPDESTSDQAVAGGIPGSRGAAPGQVGGSGGTLGQPSAYPGGRMPSASSTGSDAPAAKLSPNAKGVVGIPGASLSTGANDDSVISAEKHNVKLENGMQMILRVQ
jgi:hypothetical protein